jgi:CspA family cold shock protein
VKHWDEAKGYGWISRPNGRDVFFHCSAVVQHGHDGHVTFEGGEGVRFQVVRDARGLHAVNVELLSDCDAGEAGGA